jgi:hypothetical protein
VRAAAISELMITVWARFIACTTSRHAHKVFTHLHVAQLYVLQNCASSARKLGEALDCLESALVDELTRARSPSLSQARSG